MIIATNDKGSWGFFSCTVYRIVKRDHCNCFSPKVLQWLCSWNAIQACLSLAEILYRPYAVSLCPDFEREFQFLSGVGAVNERAILDDPTTALSITEWQCRI